ncbi:MAG: serine/threonine-protein kinase [Candidatus Latescibacterota bacterium]
MRQDRFARLRKLLLEVVALPESNRRAYLEAECGDDSELLREIESLLAHDMDRRAILDTHEGGGGLEPETLPNLEGYRIIHKLGEGGMGEVFLAEQEQPLRRRVAMKIIKLGMNSREVMARFEAERQALAILNHPNIASIYDAGSTEDGRPFFVMELIEGDPITDYLKRHHLSINERLELFILVCKAIHHAHQKGLIHRDIKPSNVLVTVQENRPVPKIIDFGVAKATNQRLTERTIYTEQGRLIGTPEYMSPEQANMKDYEVDVATDIYSLGVLLYELLVGTLPFHPQMLRDAGFDGMLQIIREVDPPLPSIKASTLDFSGTVATLCRNRKTPYLARQLRGELDWITMKAIAKDRTRRYASAQELIDDIRRYLDGDRVLARPPGISFRFSKAIRRNRHRAFSYTAFLILIAALAATAVYLAGNPGRPDHGSLAVVEEIGLSSARGISVRGEVLWARRLPGRIWPNGPWENAKRPHTIVELDGKPVGTILSIWPDVGPGSLWYLAAETGKVLWTREARWDVAPVNSQGHLVYDWNVLLRWPGRAEPVLAAYLQDGPYYLSALMFITLTNEVLGTYHHPGPLIYCDTLQLHGNTPSILLYGSNSSSRFIREFVPFETGHHPGCVILIEPQAIQGQAYPYARGLPEQRDWPGMAEANEQSYLLIPPVGPDRGAIVRDLSATRNAQGEVSIQAAADDGRIITLDADLRPVNVFLPLNSTAYTLHKAGQGFFLPYLLIRNNQGEYVEVPVSAD